MKPPRVLHRMRRAQAVGACRRQQGAQAAAQGTGWRWWCHRPVSRACRGGVCAAWRAAAGPGAAAQPEITHCLVASPSAVSAQRPPAARRPSARCFGGVLPSVCACMIQLSRSTRGVGSVPDRIDMKAKSEHRQRSSASKHDKMYFDIAPLVPAPASRGKVLVMKGFAHVESQLLLRQVTTRYSTQALCCFQRWPLLSTSAEGRGMGDGEEGEPVASVPTEICVLDLGDPTECPPLTSFLPFPSTTRIVCIAE